jgi:hypothetical protein
VIQPGTCALRTLRVASDSVTAKAKRKFSVPPLLSTSPPKTSRSNESVTRASEKRDTSRSRHETIYREKDFISFSLFDHLRVKSCRVVRCFLSDTGYGSDSTRCSSSVNEFWQHTTNVAELEDNFKHQALPLARIKKVMKSDFEVKMISSEVTILLEKACQSQSRSAFSRPTHSIDARPTISPQQSSFRS